LIETGHKEKNITGITFIDLRATYNTVNYILLLEKLYKLTDDRKLVKVVETLLRNRRFFVFLESKKSRWRTQNNGLPQGSVLAPILYNVYTN
jgi:predicted nucleic-acid-binding protein